MVFSIDTSFEFTECIGKFLPKERPDAGVFSFKDENWYPYDTI